MQEPVISDNKTTNRELLDFVFAWPKWFFLVGGALNGLIVAGVAVVLVMLWLGLQFLGYAHPVYWGFLIVNFVFWIGVSHAGIMISAILRLTQAEWRRPVTRDRKSVV